MIHELPSSVELEDFSPVRLELSPRALRASIRAATEVLSRLDKCEWRKGEDPKDMALAQFHNGLAEFVRSARVSENSAKKERHPTNWPSF